MVKQVKKKSPRRWTNLYKIARELEKRIFVVVTYMLKFKDFSTKCLWFGSPWEMWILKLFRRHQFFEAMLILTVPGLRNIIFEEKGFFGKYFSKIFFEKICCKNIFQENSQKNIFLEKSGWGQLWFWGSGPENYSPDLTPDFWKLFWSRNGSP